MPLRFVRSKVPGNIDPLQAAISTTALAKDLLSSLQFPPAMAAVSVVLLILETVQNIQANKVGCITLTRQAAQILVNIDHQMQGRWDSAPQRLVQNLQKFEGTLKVIHKFMEELAKLKWSDRFLRKSSIEDALAEHTRMLDEAAQSFQLATLIDLHCAVDTISRGNTEIQVTTQPYTEDPPPYKKKKTQSFSVQELEDTESSLAAIIDVHELTGSPKKHSVSSLREEHCVIEITTDSARETLNDHYLPEELSSPTLENSHGFQRYHQSDIVLQGRSRNLKEDWWAGATEVQVQEQSVLMKRYDNPKTKAFRHWLRDVKILQNLYHPNLPQMLGFSNDETPTPFILLSNVKTQSPEAIVRQTLRTARLATCIELMLRFYRDLADTAIYVQRQLNLTGSQVQDYFEAAGFRVDSQQTLVVGLPPPQEGRWYSARNYGLAHTLLDTCLQMLPNHGRITYSPDDCDDEEEMQKKINHLVTLARSLLPSGTEPPKLSSRLRRLIEDNEFDTSSLTLRQVRHLTLHASAHDHSWRERSVPPCKFSVGDFGYVPRGKDWNSFVRLGNAFERGAGALQLSFRAHGEHWCWESVPVRRQPLQVFPIPVDISGWPVAVPPYKQIDVAVVHEAFVTCVKDAWQYLLEHAKKIAYNAEVDSINPEDIVLVTHSGTYQDFYIKDFRPQPFGTNQSAKVTANARNRLPMHVFSQPPGFGLHAHSLLNQPMLPSVVYLFTALSPSHEPYWSSSPTYSMPGSDRPSLDRHFAYRIGYKSGFLNYVQLHAEDFEDQ